jgi:hypothetical protein
VRLFEGLYNRELTECLCPCVSEDQGRQRFGKRDASWDVSARRGGGDASLRLTPMGPCVLVHMRAR